MQIDDENSSSIDNLEKIAPKQKLVKKKVIPDDENKSTTNTSFHLPLPKGFDHFKAKENNSEDKKNPVKSSSDDADNQKKVERKDNNVDLVKSNLTTQLKLTSKLQKNKNYVISTIPKVNHQKRKEQAILRRNMWRKITFRRSLPK